MSQKSTFELNAVGDVRVLEFRGRVDAHVTPDTRARVLELVASGHDLLVIDLEGVEFVDSSGLSVFITALKRASESGGEAVMSRVSPPVRSLLELTRLHRIFRVFDDPDTAVRWLTETRPVRESREPSAVEQGG